MDRSSFLALGLLFAACHSTPKKHDAQLAPVAPAPKDALVFETLLQGYQSGVHARNAELVTNEAQWNAFWKRHSSWSLGAAAAPKVDFESKSVLALCLGDRPSGGYGLDVRWVAPRNGGLVVHALERKPAKDAFVPQVVTQPYQLVLVPRASGKVELELE